jgi:uncharacterized protein (TIGR00266 family)
MPKTKKKPLKTLSRKKSSKVVKDAKLYVDDKNKPNRNKFIPDYQITDNKAFESIIFKLKKDQAIINNRGCMSYMDADIITKTTSRGGIFKGLFRSALTSASMFMTRYTGARNENILCNASFFSGEILSVIVKPGMKIMVSPHSLICFTDNLDINSKRRVRGIFVSEGIYQSEFVNSTDEDGMVWITAYGGYKKLVLKEDESIKLDNGLFLCSNTETKYDISMVGNLKTTMFSGEGLSMLFKGPCEIYMHSRNFNALVKYIIARCPPGKKN